MILRHVTEVSNVCTGWAERKDRHFYVYIIIIVIINKCGRPSEKTPLGITWMVQILTKKERRLLCVQSWTNISIRSTPRDLRLWFSVCPLSTEELICHLELTWLSVWIPCLINNQFGSEICQFYKSFRSAAIYILNVDKQYCLSDILLSLRIV